MAKRKKGEEPDVLYRAVRFEAKPNPAELELLLVASENLRGVYNAALEERKASFDTHIAPLYAEVKLAEGEEAKRIRQAIKEAYKEHPVTFFDQVNSLTPRRETDPRFASVTRNWQEETLDTVNAGFVSFAALRAAGDYDARPPKPRRENSFSEIPGRSGFKVRDGRSKSPSGEPRGMLPSGAPDRRYPDVANLLRENPGVCYGGNLVVAFDPE